MADWTTEYITLIEDCEKRSERMTDWESQFIDSLSNQLALERRPTPKQIETLDAIWEKVTARG
ncbi:MAG: hypothetical protein JWN23_1570 [Rhodocyclales bacterium]|nr:hypothetical protein [Rhodocyclales bacterium]